MALDLEVLCLNDDSKIGGNRVSTALSGAVGRFVQVSGYIGGLTGHAPFWETRLGRSRRSQAG